MTTSKFTTHALPLPVAPVVVDLSREGASTQATLGAEGGVREVRTRAIAVEGSRLAAGLRPGIMVGVMLASDAACLSLAWGAAVYGRWLFNGRYDLVLYLKLWPLLPLFLVAYACARLYPSAPLSRPEELRKLTLVSSLVCLALATATFFAREGYTYSRSVLALGWLLSVVLVPTGRSLVRLALSGRTWWGIPVVIIGDGPTAVGVMRTLLRQPEAGLKPVAVLRRYRRGSRSILGVPVLGTVTQVRRLRDKYRIAYAVVSMSDLPEGRARMMLDEYARTFSHLMVVPDLSGLSSLWVQATDLGGVLGLEVRHRLLDPWRMTLKRVLDLALIAAFSPVLAPLVGLIALAVWLDRSGGRGPVFYRHERIGLHQRRFGAWKFRTMVPDADQILERYLAAHPELRSEWETTQKLKDDPRITRVGWWLRRTSLDELPQVWNVLVGEMSLVGPRPIVDEEVEKYGEHFGLYCKVRPGITGVWQTHGRNLLTYDERVQMDGYYVRNWSVWLDVWLLSRTVLPVLLCRGAY